MTNHFFDDKLSFYPFMPFFGCFCVYLCLLGQLRESQQPGCL
jgi:hypothetical protein